MTAETPSQTKRPRVRFAPSPTGYLHVGGARTALFNWLFARHTGGTFILRIEDTDFERSSEEMVGGILEGMRWLGLDWDEGPFFQSERLQLYRETAARLAASGDAYPCFCTREELEQRRKEATAAGRPTLYDRRCRRIRKEEAEVRVAGGEQAALRFAVPEEGSTGFDDAVFGRVEFANEEIEDFVLLRSDGIPTYHLSVVADDVDLRLTHVIRGADHISNTPKQVLLYRALGAELPVFAHLPLILGPDRTRLSKRHGATSVTAYKEMGYVAEAFRNFLALLGWTPGKGKDENGKDREMFSSGELVEMFSLEGISKSNAVFDNDKLAWFSGEYLRALPAEELAMRIAPFFAEARLEATPEKLLAIAPLIRERIRTLREAVSVANFFFVDELAPYDAGDLIPQKGDAALARRILVYAATVLARSGFDAATLEQTLREAATALGVKTGAMFQPIRVAVCGRKNAPPLFETMEVLGRATCLKRMEEAEAKLAAMS